MEMSSLPHRKINSFEKKKKYNPNRLIVKFQTSLKLTPKQHKIHEGMQWFTMEDAYTVDKPEGSLMEQIVYNSFDGHFT